MEHKAAVQDMVVAGQVVVVAATPTVAVAAAEEDRLEQSGYLGLHKHKQ